MVVGTMKARVLSCSLLCVSLNALVSMWLTRMIKKTLIICNEWVDEAHRATSASFYCKALSFLSRPKSGTQEGCGQEGGR